MDDKYKRAWDAAYNKFKELCEIKDFHGLQFKTRHMVSLEYVLEYMDECLKNNSGTPIEECEDCVSRQAVLDAIDKWVRSMHVLVALPAHEVTPLFESVRELPPVTPAEKQEPCTDAISRQAAIDTFYKYPNVSWTTLDILEKINSLPPVTAERVGHWISNAEDDLKISEYTCSNCKGLSDEDSDFCPKCGSYNGGAE